MWRHTVWQPLPPTRHGKPGCYCTVWTVTLAPYATEAAPGAAPTRPRLRRVNFEPEPGAAPAGPLPVTPASGGAGAEPTAASREFMAAYRDVARILRVALEVLDRRRPSGQLAGHFAPAPLRCWQVAVTRRRPRSPAEPLRIRMCMPRSGVAEVALAADMDGRVRAVAARFEHTGTGWQCTDVRLG